MSDRFKKVVVEAEGAPASAAVYDTQENRFALFNAKPNDDLADVLGHLVEYDPEIWQWTPANEVTVVNE